MGHGAFAQKSVRQVGELAGDPRRRGFIASRAGEEGGRLTQGFRIGIQQTLRSAKNVESAALSAIGMVL